MQFKKIFVTMIFLGILSFDTLAQGDLIITPNRVVFEGRKLKEELNLVNTGKEIATYSVSFVQRRMHEDGSFEMIQVPDSGQMFADPYLRIYPRQVTLEPGEPQVIMLQCRRKPGMKDGEYRSHLYFRSEKKYTPLGFKDSEPDPKSVSVQLTPIYGMSIPVIVRSGEVHATVSLSDLKLETDKTGQANLTAVLNRTGNISIYGNLKAEFLPVHGKPITMGATNGVAVYTNLEKRHIAIKLTNTASTPLTSGKLKLSYTSRADEQYVVYADAELNLK